MYKISIFFSFLLLQFVVHGQEMIHWTTAYSAQSSSIELVASIKEGWHLYSQKVDIEAGPVPTSFQFEKNESYTLVGTVKEPIAIIEFDNNFGGELAFFKGEVLFTQKVKLKSETNIKGSVTYMLCNEEMCLPPRDESFEIKIEN